MSIASSPKALFPTLGQIAPVSAAPAAVLNTGATYLQIPPGATKLKVTAMVGAVGSTPSCTLSANQATSSAGAGTKACAGITGTFGTVAGTTAQFDFDLSQVMDVNGGFNFLQLVVTNNGTTTNTLVALEAETGPGPYLA